MISHHFKLRMTVDTDWMEGGGVWSGGLTRKPCVTVIGVTFNNVGLARPKTSPCCKCGWPFLSIVSGQCCVSILTVLRKRRIMETQLRASLCSRSCSV